MATNDKRERQLANGLVSTLKLFTLRSTSARQVQPTRILRAMTWLFWAILSAVFAAATALLAKVGVAGIDSNLATAIRTSSSSCLPGPSLSASKSIMR